MEARSLLRTSTTWSKSRFIQRFAKPTSRPVFRWSMVNRSSWASRLLGEPLPEKVSGSDRASCRSSSGPLSVDGALISWEEAPGGLRARPSIMRRPIRDRHRRHRGSSRFDERPCRRRGRVGRAHSGGRSASHLGRAWGSRIGIRHFHNVAPRIKPAVAIGIGAGFDFISGRMRRAPRWMSRRGLEWLFRLAQEPRRLARRYLIDDTKFIGILFRTIRDPAEGRVAVFRPPPRRPTLFSGPSSRRRTS